MTWWDRAAEHRATGNLVVGEVPERIVQIALHGVHDWDAWDPFWAGAAWSQDRWDMWLSTPEGLRFLQGPKAKE